MSESSASRTLVKSPPELWSEVSTAESLQRHMEQFGEIHVTKLEPETAVAWEGEHARGTIRLEPSGWGTKVSLTATAVGPSGGEEVKTPTQGEVDRDEHPGTTLAQPYEAVDAEVRALTALVQQHKRQSEDRWTRRMARRMRRWFGSELEEDTGQPAASPPAQDAAPVAHETAPVPEVSQVTQDPQPEASQPQGTEPESTEPAALTAVLDSLGRAHHRPYSRA